MSFRKESPFQLSIGTRIAQGPDSLVHLIGNSVVKEYPALTFATLRQYKQATNRIALSLVTNPITGLAEFDGNEWQVQFFVAPIDTLIETIPPQATSQYILGPNGWNMLRASSAAIDAITKLGPTDEREFLLDLVSKLRGRDFLKYFIDCTNPSRVVERILKETDIESVPTIARTNTKVRADMEQRVLKIIITDLASHISFLRFKESREASLIPLS